MMINSDKPSRFGAPFLSTILVGWIKTTTIIWGDEHPLLDMISCFDVHCGTRVLTHSHGNQYMLDGWYEEVYGDMG